MDTKGILWSVERVGYPGGYFLSVSWGRLQRASRLKRRFCRGYHQGELGSPDGPDFKSAGQINVGRLISLTVVRM